MIPDPVPDVAGRDLVDVEVDTSRFDVGILRARVASLRLHRTFLRRRIERLEAEVAWWHDWASAMPYDPRDDMPDFDAEEGDDAHRL